LSAALLGSGIGLGLGAIYMMAGMAQVATDHGRAARIAAETGGGVSETMLQREINRLDPAALRLARAHDATSGDSGRDPAGAWPASIGERPGPGRGASALDASRQLDCLTDAVYFEARGETPRGQAAVAQVVMNRVKNPSFPKTVCGVVFQGAASHGCQFSFACDGSMRRRLEAGAWERARRIAERALSGRVLGDIGKATHFHTIDVQPDWAPQMLRVAQVGLHVFYRFNPHPPAASALDAQRAVLVSVPLAPGDNLRVATAVLEKAADATVSASGLASGDVKPPAAKPPEPLASAAKPTDAAVSSRASTDAAAS
jgi:hypothetical protein